MLALGNKNEKKRFVIYTRCSTDDQAQGDFTTLDAQAFHCKNMLEAFGYELSAFGGTGIINDDGYSGKDLNRPGIKAILEGVDGKRTFDGIIFFRLDRLTRNPRDLYAMIDLFRDKNIDFVSVRENLDSSTAIGRVVIGILGLLSAFERELTGERVKASALARVKQGMWVGGTVPYGYMLIDDGPRLSNDKQPHKLVVNEAVAGKLRVAWEMAAENRPLSEIANELIAMGIKGPMGKNWLKQTLSAIIKNPFYKGLIKYNGEYFKGKHTPIISDELWALANQRIKEKLPGHQFIPRQKEYAYLLSGLLKCGYCGSHYIATSCVSHGTRHYYYNCGRAKQKIGCDNTKSIKARQLDAALLEYFKRASQDRTLIAKAIGKALIEAKEHYDAADRAYADSAAKLAQLQAEGQRMLDLAVKGDIQRGPSYKAKLAKVEAAITEQEKEVEKLKQTRDEHGMMAYAGEHITENIEYALANFDKAQPETQRNLLRALIKDIRLFDDKAEISLYLIDGKLTNTPEQGTEPQTGKNTGSEGQENNGEKGKKITPRIDGGLNTSETMFVSRQSWLPGTISNCGQYIPLDPSVVRNMRNQVLLWDNIPIRYEKGPRGHLRIVVA